MASLSQLHKDWYEKTEQVRQLNAELSSKRVEHDRLKKESLAFNEERRQAESELAKREADVKQREQLVNVALARTEATIRFDIEKLNDEIITKQRGIQELDKTIKEQQTAVKQLGKVIQSLEATTSGLKKSHSLKMEELDQLRHKVELERDKVKAAKKHLAQAQAELERVSTDTRNLTKLKHDLDMYYMRIKNYYKKAGLHFVDEKYVGISSN